MKFIKAFVRLVRWPNLVFIGITQALFVYSIVHPIIYQAGAVPNVRGKYFVWIVISSILIAAAGYIINDYFDLNIDLVNKPDKLVVAKIISRRWVIFWHLLFSTAGVVIGFYIDWYTRIRFLGLANMGCVALLFIYSISLKKKMLVGNVVISAMTAWVILVITWCETSNLLQPALLRHFTQKITRISFLYAGFAFVISLIREVVKDMEDIEGDRRYGGRTLPIVLGINATKVFVAVWLTVLACALSAVQFYALILQWWWSATYSVLFIIVPFIFAFRWLVKAATPTDYHRLSTLVKVIMFTGILSMIFFRLYAG